jgi:hypothetical protein
LQIRLGLAGGVPDEGRAERLQLDFDLSCAGQAAAEFADVGEPRWQRVGGAALPSAGFRLQLAAELAGPDMENSPTPAMEKRSLGEAVKNWGATGSSECVPG